jgi:hypothetical protein
MPRFLETITLGEIAVLGAILTAAIAFLRKAIPALRKASRLIDDVVGAPDHPGVMDRLTALERQVGQVADSAGAAAVQLYSNGGSSARDQIDKTRDQIETLREGQEEILRRLNDIIPPQP